MRDQRVCVGRAIAGSDTLGKRLKEACHNTLGLWALDGLAAQSFGLDALIAVTGATARGGGAVSASPRQVAMC